MEDHHRYIDNLDKFEQVLLLIHSVHMPWGHRLMQKRNEKKKKLVCGRNENLKDFECSPHGRYIVSQIRQNAIIFQKKKGRKKGKRGNLHKFSERTFGVFVVVLYVHDQKRNKKKMFRRKVLPGFEPG